MHLDAIKMFTEVAHHRSFSKAARESGITQSAVSQRIMALERELSVQLIDRSTRPLQLTPAGNIYLQGVKKLLDRYEQLKQQVTGNASYLKGEVTIAAIYSAGIGLLNEIKSRFQESNPDCKISLKYFQPDEVYHQVRAEKVDIGILSYPSRWRDLASISLRDEPMVVVCPPSHAFARRQVLHPADLSEWSMVNFEKSLPIARSIRKYLRSHGIDVEVETEFDNIDTMKSYLAMTNTFGILPERTVAKDVARGALVAVSLQPELARPVAVVYPRHRDLKPTAKHFIDFLLQHQNEADPSSNSLSSGSSSATIESA